jgi:hypothetical protein
MLVFARLGWVHSQRLKAAKEPSELSRTSFCFALNRKVCATTCAGTLVNLVHLDRTELLLLTVLLPATLLGRLKVALQRLKVYNAIESTPHAYHSFPAPQGPVL